MLCNASALTAKESAVYRLNGVGKQTKEIAEIMQTSYETVKSHMKNIKAKLGLQKDKELTAHFWCSLSGKNFDEVKHQILATCLLISFLLYIPIDRVQIRQRTFETRGRITLVARRNEYTA